MLLGSPFTTVDGEALVCTDLDGLPVGLHVRALEGLERILTRRLGFHRIVVSEKETPNMLANLVRSG
jgi:hypothetical protein